jgi:hypothetical protein
MFSGLSRLFTMPHSPQARSAPSPEPVEERWNLVDHDEEAGWSRVRADEFAGQDSARAVGWVDLQPPPPPTRSAPFTPAQQRAFGECQRAASALSFAAFQPFLDRLKFLGIDRFSAQRMLEYVAHEAPITVNFSPERLLPAGGPRTVLSSMLTDESGRYRTFFDTGVSCGKGAADGKRVKVESETFHYPVDLPPSERMAYGAINAQRWPEGGAPGYGDCYLVLKPCVRDRVTITPLDSFGVTKEQVGTLLNAAHVLNALDGCSLREIALRACYPNEPVPPFEETGRYLEAQVHGGLALNEVSELVADEAYVGTEYESRLRDLAQENGWTLRWKHGQQLVRDEG